MGIVCLIWPRSERIFSGVAFAVLDVILVLRMCGVVNVGILFAVANVPVRTGHL